MRAPGRREVGCREAAVELLERADAAAAEHGLDGRLAQVPAPGATVMKHREDWLRRCGDRLVWAAPAVASLCSR